MERSGGVFISYRRCDRSIIDTCMQVVSRELVSQASALKKWPGAWWG